MTQTQAAASIGVTQTMWNHYEKSVKFPGQKEFVHILEAFFYDDSENAFMRIRYSRALEDWERLGPPATTQTYNAPSSPYKKSRT